MSFESPGDHPRVSPLLSPRAASALDNLESPNKIDLNFLNEEITILRKTVLESQIVNYFIKLIIYLKLLTNKNSANSRKSFKYNKSDKGPFCVIIESISDNIGNLNAMNVGKCLHTSHKNNLDIKDICRKELKRAGVYYVYIPARMVTSMGIVRDIGSDITEEDIIQYGVAMFPNTPIPRVPRFKRNIIVNDTTTRVPSGTCYLSSKIF